MSQRSQVQAMLRRVREAGTAAAHAVSAGTSFGHLIDPAIPARPRPSAIPDIQTVWKGQRVRAVWNRVYLRPLREGLGEFALLVLKWTLGRAWFLRECEKAPGSRHQIVAWYYHYYEWQRVNMKPENAVPGGGWSAKPDGHVRALLCLSEDVFDLQSVNRLPRNLLCRLKDPQAFQGARYEIAVAGMFARLDYEIDWLGHGSQRHCEFIAIHRASGVRIAVEAKSRHRRGVLGYPGVYDRDASLKADIGRQLEEAMSQAPDGMPFVIFIDLNAPPTPGLPLPEKPWFAQFRELVSRGGEPSPARPDPYNAVFLTNYAYHHMGSQDATGAREHLCCVSTHPRNKLPGPRYLTDLEREVATYGRARPTH